jgi:phenylpyruvate tautomerase PptA (4-oxalocrotonate tautomerase family)
MPIIDVYAPADTFPPGTERALAQQLTTVVMRAEGFGDSPPEAIKAITGCYLHWLPADAVHTAASDRAGTVRVQVTTAAGGLNQDGRDETVAQITDIIAATGGDPSLVERTWVIITEAVEGGWGINGVAFGKHNSAGAFT